MAKKKDVSEEKSVDQCWIYEGERRPVVVYAKNERHAKDKVRKSPHYDGFPIVVYPILKFISKCAPIEDVPVPVAGPEEKFDDSKVYFTAKAVSNRIIEVKVYSDGKAAVNDSDKLSEHLDREKDDLKVFVLDNHQEIGENEFIEARIHHEPLAPKKKAPEIIKVEEKVKVEEKKETA
jgi:hypothetical protein